MNVAVIGSRSFDNYERLSLILSTLNEHLKIDKIVSGGANGADKLGERFAVENNIETLIFLPDWNKYGKSAGFIRNKDIINNSDIVIAFWDGESKGTKHSIDYALKLGKRVIIK